MEVQIFQLQKSTTGKMSDYVCDHKYEILLFSFLLLVFGNTFSNNEKIYNVLIMYQNIIAGCIVFPNQKRTRKVIFGLILFSLLLDMYQSMHPFTLSRSLHSTIYITFFSLVSIEVYKVLLYSKRVTRELLSAAMCGFVLFCLISTFLFVELEASLPHSFSNIGTGKEVMPNLNYFSFVTLLTIGYGDILPLTLVAKRAVMLMGLTGHFYTVFITSIIIRKYLSQKQP